MRKFLMILSVTGLLTPLVAHPDGRTLYENYCQICHGSEGKGDGAGVPETMIRPRPFSAAAFKFDTDADWEKGSDTDLANVIRNGTAAYGGSSLMPAWSNLQDEEVDELVAYIRRLQVR
ncbi:MAG: cytochrome c [Pseudomonadales bacterium]|nr:cytochrome c [Pseudomonadales bacterium]